MAKKIVVLGSFVADVAFRAARLPAWGETLMGSGFALGPGGKGSNQAVAAARAGANRADALAAGRRRVRQAGARDLGSRWNRCVPGGELRDAHRLCGDPDRRGEGRERHHRRSRSLLHARAKGCGSGRRRDSLRRRLLTQLELPLDTVERGLRIARAAGVQTILNPAPAQPLSDTLLALADFLIPNESEAALLTGFRSRAWRRQRPRHARCWSAALVALS